MLTCASHTGGAGAVHRLGLCQRLMTLSCVTCGCVSDRRVRVRTGRVSGIILERPVGPVPRPRATSTAHTLSTLWRLVTLTLVGDMSRLRDRDSRLSAVSLSPLSLRSESLAAPPSPETVHSRRRAASRSASRVTLTSRVRISHRAVKPPRRVAARM